MFQKILVATDGSDNALQTARHIAESVRREPAEVTVRSNCSVLLVR